jgi:hypothetical protein
MASKHHKPERAARNTFSTTAQPCSIILVTTVGLPRSGPLCISGQQVSENQPEFNSPESVHKARPRLAYG